MANHFSVTLGNMQNGVKAVFSGYLNETAQLPPLKKEQNLFVDLDAVIGLNSVGTRKWCNWINDCARLFDKIYLENCPVIFVKTFNQITDSLTENCVVNSLKIPFYSEAIDERKNVIFYLGKDYSFDGIYTVPEVKDSTGNLMEIDIIPETYFVFLNK